MIREDMTVTEVVMVLWSNKIKVAVLLLAIVFGPGLYDDSQKKRAAEQLEADHKSVDTNASIAGVMLMSAWKSCTQIGIVNDMERCAAYEGRLPQEQAAPPLAKLAIEHRASYYKNCQRFHPYEYCKRRTNVVGPFPNDASITRLVGAMMLEQNDEWSLNRRYM